ncbi:MAG: LLM class flavin-dependent oxidoreductase [Actinomycetota bacterium]|jgi:5,10-methylenetetrahydromethanopterin reductase|nr:LLM class flavin-dependent oxidoreductase [Actinomycetota bacterium]
MKLGMLLGFEDTLETVVSVAREAEAAGAASVYLVEAGRSAFVPAAAVAAATTEVQIGTYVVNAFGRSAWLTGLAARDLDELSEGRFTLGVGTGNPHFNDWYMGVDSSKPLQYMREFVEVVRQVVNAQAGDRVRYEGTTHQMRWRASYAPYRPTIPVYLAGSGPNMRRVAAEVSDGIGVGIMSSPQFMADHVRPQAAAAAEAVGRSVDDLAFPMGAQVSVNRDAATARKAARLAVCGLFHPVPHPYYDSQLRQLGYSDVADDLAELMPAGQVREAMQRVPDEVIDTMTITGTPAECAARLHDYEGLADEVVAIRVAQPDEPTGLAAYADLLEMASLAARGD